MRRKRYRRFKRVSFRLNPKVTWAVSGIFISALILGLLGYAVYSCEDFKVKKENIISNITLSGLLVKKMEGKSLFSLDTAVIAEGIMKGHPEYKDILVSKEFPSSIVINVVKRLAVAQIKSKKFYPVDKEAVVLSRGAAEPSDNLICVEFDGKSRLFTRGYNIRDNRLSYAFNLIEILKKEQLLNDFTVGLINSVSLEAAYFTLEQKNYGAAEDLAADNIRIIVGKDDAGQKVKILQGLIEGELKDKMSLVKYIDLRYKKVYVGFKR